jgi:H+/gluconate symporter-like permease
MSRLKLNGAAVTVAASKMKMTGEKRIGFRLSIMGWLFKRLR